MDIYNKIEILEMMWLVMLTTSRVAMDGVARNMCSTSCSEKMIIGRHPDTRGYGI